MKRTNQWAVPFLLWGMLLLVILCSRAFALDLDKLQAQAIYPVVQLNRNCTASFISSERDKATGLVTTYLLTAKHCVTGGENLRQTVYVPIYDKGRLVAESAMVAEVKSTYSKGDLALIELLDRNRWFSEVVTIAPQDVDLREGEDAWIVGYPRGESRTVTDGRLGNLQVIPFPNPRVHTEYRRASPQVAGGNSGGPLFHMTKDGDFHQIGVLTAGIPASDFMTYSTPLEAIRDYLGKALPTIFGAKVAAK